MVIYLVDKKYQPADCAIYLASKICYIGCQYDSIYMRMHMPMHADTHLKEDSKMKIASFKVYLWDNGGIIRHKNEGMLNYNVYFSFPFKKWLYHEK